MMKILRWKFIRLLVPVLVLALLVIQLVPVDRSNPPLETEVPAPAPVRAILRRACYDCHSHETVWPWYSKVAPVSWLVANDVYEGRRELNYSTWNRYAPKDQAKKLKESIEEVAEQEMPPWAYLLAHREAAISGEDRELLRQWAAGATTAANEG